jgi:hypothetical protein
MFERLFFGFDSGRFPCWLYRLANDFCPRFGVGCLFVSWARGLAGCYLQMVCPEDDLPEVK